ncbi:pseudouridine synthase [Psychromonas aquatilis]|uniref:Pseudouridine synthase n=1 Tax=Psychromonas aquatilis TaxID=2005072 RepID=A0ABU9GR79_9GAMM
MRLDKFVAKSTTLSKQQIQQKIAENAVYVNGIIIEDPAYQVHENNKVTLNGEQLIARPSRYLLLHKPANTICSNIDEVYPSVMTLLKTQSTLENIDQLHIAGRLDADTTGLVLITDDGRWTFNITSPAYHCPKVYRVGLSNPFKAELVTRFEQGIQLQGEKQLTLPAVIEQISEKEVLLTITQGKFHQVKRMFAAVGNRVINLHREQIGDLKLDVACGEWRFLTAVEIASFTSKP